ncbi:hypothetical protein K1719_003216 [Acacia pycnantha]|nr:hypothetical protein K1719_003216 [Acacia pycnantha]
MKVGSYKLSALEIESVIFENPAVSECFTQSLKSFTIHSIIITVVLHPPSSVFQFLVDSRRLMWALLLCLLVGFVSRLW